MSWEQTSLQAERVAIEIIRKSASRWYYPCGQPKCSHKIVGLAEGIYKVYHGTSWSCFDPKNLGRPVERCVAVKKDGSLHFADGHPAGECPWLIYEKSKKNGIEGKYNRHFAVIRGALIMSPELAKRVGFRGSWRSQSGCNGPQEVLANPAFEGWSGSYSDGEFEMLQLWLTKIEQVEEEDKERKDNS